jgi:hypothetical protein
VRAGQVGTGAVRGVASKLKPEFIELDRALQQHLDQVTDDIMKLAISSDTSEAEEVWISLESVES